MTLPRYRAAQGERPLLPQFILLSMLLHLLIIAMFGTISGTGAQRGELWGQIQVTLQSLTNDHSGAGGRLSTPDSAASAPASERAALPSRQQTAAPSPSVPRATAETPAPFERAPDEALPRLNPAAPEQVDKAYEPVPAPLPDTAPIVVPQRLEPIVPQRMERELTGPTELLPRRAPIAPIAPAPLERLHPPTLDRDLVPSVELVPRAAPIVPTPIERIAPRPIERNLAPPVQLTPREAPIVPAPIERIAPRPIEHDLAPPVQLTPREAPVVPAPIEHIAPRQIERDLAPPVEIAPRELPVTPSPIERLAPPPVAQRQLAPAVEVQPTRPAPAEIPATRNAAVPTTSLPGAEPAQRSAAPAANLPERFHFGSPTPEEEIFRPRGGVMPALAEPGGQPYLDLQAARSRAVHEVAADTSSHRGIYQMAPPAIPDAQTKDARAIEKAIKPDCRTAYAGLGLLAIPVLVAAALAETGCNW